MKTTIVTGAAGGMGAALCRALIADGGAVVAVDHNQGRLDALAVECGARLSAVCVDMLADDLADRVLPFCDGSLSGLVNVAAISQGAEVSKIADADWEASFAVNVTAPMRLTRVVLPQLIANGAGSIVNVSSPVGVAGARKVSYAASKAALHGLTMASAREGGPHGVRVNTVLPGPTITFMTNDWSQEKCDGIAAETFLKRLCVPEEIADVIVFLLSPASRYMTGSTIDMTAGSLYGH